MINYDKNFNCRSQILSKMVVAAETALLQIFPDLFSLRAGGSAKIRLETRHFFSDKTNFALPPF